jgi:methylated-DNA-[protein]-cysteine S-methyltransferase
MTNTIPVFTFFDTPIGRCAVGWGERGVIAVQLPEARPAQTRARLLQRLPNAREATPPPEVVNTLQRIQALMRGEASDLTSVVLDMDGVPPFHRRVYDMARTIPPGSTLSYGELASRLGVRGSARAVGQALGRNPFPIIVPCHRVLAAGGKLGGFSANGGVSTKLRMLAIEGARMGEVETAFDGDGKLGFDPRAAVDHLRASDLALARLIDAAGPFRLRLQKTSSVFGALAEAIVYQQLTGKAAATILARVCALFPRGSADLTARRVLRASDEQLRGAGLSRAKVLSLRDLARRVENGEIPTLAEARAMEDHEVVSRLTEVRGIGRWTAEMFLIFRLGRPDVLPLDDYGVRKGFAVAFRKRALPTREALERRGMRWKPYRTVASWYLWCAAERSSS